MSDNNRIAYQEQDVQALIDFFSNHATYKEVFKMLDVIKRGQRITLNLPPEVPAALPVVDTPPEVPVTLEPPQKTRKPRKAKAQETV